MVNIKNITIEHEEDVRGIKQTMYCFILQNCMRLDSKYQEHHHSS